jgi:hypothetical protein
LRLVEVIQITAVLCGMIFTIIMTFEKKLLKKLRTQDATSPQKAVSLPKLNRPTRLWLSRLIKHGVIKITGDGMYFIDEDVYRLLRNRRFKIAIITVLLIITLIVLFHFIIGV